MNNKIIRLFIYHIILLIGSVVFALPFVWLITTTIKEDTEIFRIPPQWFPKLPVTTHSSPYISLREFDELKKPEACDKAKWNEIKEPLFNTIKEEVKARVPQTLKTILFNPTIKLNFNSASNEASEGVWHFIKDSIPDATWNGTENEILSLIKKRINDNNIFDSYNRVIKREMVGELFIEDTDLNNAKAEWLSAWTPIGNKNVYLTEMHEKETEGTYTLFGDNFENGNKVTFARLFGSPFLTENLRNINLQLKNNKSFYRLWISVETVNGVFKVKKPFILDNDGFQDVKSSFTKEKFQYMQKKPLLFEKVSDANVILKDKSNPNIYGLVLTVEKVPYTTMLLYKAEKNYKGALEYIPFWTYTQVSIYLVILNILGQLLACSLVAYSFARLRWYGRDGLFLLLISTMMLPPQVTMIPVFLIFKKFHWYNTLKPLWVPAFCGAAFYVFLLRQFLLGIPTDLEDSAKIDGCSYLGIYRLIMLPLIKPALATIAIFQFLGTWNDFMGPLIYISREKLTPLPLGLYMFMAANSTSEFALLMAAALLMTLPVIIIFFFAQRYFIQGITLTGLKM